MDETTEEDSRDPPTTPTNTREGSGSGPNSGKSPDSRPASPETQEIPGKFILKILISEFRSFINVQPIHMEEERKGQERKNSPYLSTL